MRMTLNEIRRRPTLPGRFQPSTISVLRLNFCVRDGNRWIPQAIVTGKEQGSCLLLPPSLFPSVRPSNGLPTSFSRVSAPGFAPSKPHRDALAFASALSLCFLRPDHGRSPLRFALTSFALSLSLPRSRFHVPASASISLSRVSGRFRSQLPAPLPHSPSLALPRAPSGFVLRFLCSLFPAPCFPALSQIKPSTD